MLTSLMMAVLLSFAAEDKADATKKDLDKMQGAWTVAAQETNGQKLTDEQIKAANIRLTVKDDTYKLSFSENTAGEGKIKLDAGPKPSTLDVMTNSGTMEGIYKFEGEKMIVNLAQPGGKRPKEFKTTADSGLIMITYQRRKDK